MPVAAQVSPTVTLREAVALARRNNPRVLDAVDRIAEAQLNDRAARSAFRPRFVPRLTGAVGGGDLANQSYGAELSQRFSWGTEVQASVSSVSSRNQLGSFYYTDTTLALSHPIHRAGPDRYKEEAESARDEVERATHERLSVEQAVAIDVAAAYYQIAAQQQVIRVAEKALERHRHLLAISTAKLEIGKVSQLDVLRASQLVREAEGQLADARAGADDARDQLRLLMGDSQLGAFDIIVDAMPAAASPPAVAATPDLAASTDVMRARAALTRAENQARAARSSWLPRIDLTLALTRREIGPDLPASFGTDRFRLVPLVQLSLPARADSTSAQLAAIAVSRHRRELESAEMRAGIEARRAVRACDRLANQLRDAEAGVAFAAQQVAVAQARFENGLSNNLDLVAAEADLLSAESRRISAAAALAVATLRLKATLGTLNLDEDFQ